MPTGHRTHVEPGDTYNYLAIIREVEKIGRARVALCRCACGNEKPFRLNQVIKGRVKSCGCQSREMIRQSRTTHGMPNKQLYSVWSGMRQRCSNPNNYNYSDYGGRGISVCDEWQDYTAFHVWAMANGYSRGLSLDRIDNGGNYEPVNCRWATPTEQARNSRRNRIITFRGQEKSLTEWAGETGIHAARIRARLDRLGWSIEDALTTPVTSPPKSDCSMEVSQLTTEAVPQTKALAPVEKLKSILRADSVQEQFENALQENRGAFIASLIDIYGSDRYLQECDPKRVVMEALKAATLKLPINKSLGFAWIVPYKGVPQFQLGYKGYVQLAMRTGQYKYLNADVVYEGELVRATKLTGELDLSGARTSDKIVGYFAHIETVNGFRKTVYWTKEKVTEHARKFSRAFSSKDSAWQTSFDAMALKTVIRHLLSHYGILSVDMMSAIAADPDAEDEASFADEVARNANVEVIDVEYTEASAEEPKAAPEQAEQPDPAAKPAATAKGKKQPEPDF